MAVFALLAAGLVFPLSFPASLLPGFPAAGPRIAQAAAAPSPAQERREQQKPPEQKPPEQQEQVLVRVLENNSFTINKEITIVKGKILIRKGEIELVGDALEYDSKRQVAILTGKVRLSKPDLTMTGEKFTADFQKENYVMEGNVFLEQKEKDRRGSALVAAYDQGREALELTGNVVIEQKGGERLKGEKVRINLKRDELEVLGPAEAEFPVKKAGNNF